MLEQLAELYQVGVGELLDKYNTFLCNGQARQVGALRSEMQLSQTDFAIHFGVNKEQVKKWETGKARMGKKFWARIFNDDYELLVNL